MKSGEEAIEWIHGLLQFGVRPGLTRMEILLEKLGHPEQKLKVIHVAGTNGKGSTVSLLSHVYEQGGYKVGTFTSPYIERFEERISLNGQPISEGDLVYCANKVRKCVDELIRETGDQPTEFEVITLMAFVYFAEKANPDLVLLEVGLGGRLDSTNVVTPLVSIITSIGYDHMNILGDTLEKITFEKAGIIKQGGIVVSGVKQLEAKKVIEQVVKEKGASYYQLGEDFTVDFIHSTADVQQLHYSGDKIYDVSIHLRGPHQRDNSAVAIKTIELLQNRGFPLDIHKIKEGMKRTSWIGRFEVIQNNLLSY
ncbi:folylpolyglutamate synthase/dihydrofolate synthase family protein [Bacillus sp. JCM 19034]|uniref:bifunctional folylpolyglutamate synthase/dihydrofolate synthase n=1 Tax=Bacillus sp. JCM 19034 TaxID=1481928 RepID=UPI000AB9D034|nr:folylpolyglutamate synthase/dihydrofolate synthase family protein [Bacillus sp. JCM 19034]